ncbi:hypothetical protein [Thermosphaera aggregans]|uniref:Uncharacterized protein n=1 Tax=Thermosphaera aggregans (strain DSM 11486 / M11TL) TaxID=633148 RepID=D5U052_THEAM|nr:hypothetical protein [Thermosphaera aggregans]ADG90502.1 hypothetical protein Tagg_0222 [Thermosphaera aggregans DSM 11486]
MSLKDRQRNRKLTEFFKKNVEKASTNKVEGSISEQPKQPESSVEEDVTKQILELVESRTSQLKAKSQVGEEPDKKPPQAKPPQSLGDELLEQIVAEEIKPIECDSKGFCTDGIKVGDFFVDKYGVKRQRGFVNTTRLPVYLDVVVEEAKVAPLLSRAYSIETSRNALAIVPEDFICELQERYGVVLQGFEKCSQGRGVSAFDTHGKRKVR